MNVVGITTLVLAALVLSDCDSGARVVNADSADTDWIARPRADADRDRRLSS